MLDPVSTRTIHRSAVLFLHGLGDVGASWKAFFSHIAARFPNTLFLFPNAPTIPITINHGFPCPGWYDIRSLENTPTSIRNQDQQGMHSSSLQISAMINDLKSKGIPHQNIILGGFSQGGVTSLYTLLSNPSYDNLAGLLLLSCYLPLSETLFSPQTYAKRNSSIPIFWGHGESDTLIPIQWAKDSISKLTMLGFQNVLFHKYPNLGHGTSAQEEIDIFNFLQSRLGNTNE